MKTVGDTLDAFSVVAAKPHFNHPEENNVSAFETITEKSFAGKWLVLYFWPKTATFVCPTEIKALDDLSQDFEDRDAVLIGGSTDNEFTQLMWRREHPDLRGLKHYSFGDPAGRLVDMLGVRDKQEGVALRATFIIDPNRVIQYAAVNNLNVGRSSAEVLRILDALQTEELCACNRQVGGATL